MRDFFAGFEKQAGWRDAVTKGVRDFVSTTGQTARAVNKGGRALESGMGAAADSLKSGRVADALLKGKGTANELRKIYNTSAKANAQTAREGGKFLTNDVSSTIDKGKDLLKRIAKRYSY